MAIAVVIGADRGIGAARVDVYRDRGDEANGSHHIPAERRLGSDHGYPSWMATDVAYFSDVRVEQAR